MYDTQILTSEGESLSKEDHESAYSVKIINKR